MDKGTEIRKEIEERYEYIMFYIQDLQRAYANKYKDDDVSFFCSIILQSAIEGIYINTHRTEFAKKIVKDILEKFDEKFDRNNYQLRIF